MPAFPVGTNGRTAKRMSEWQTKLDALYQPLNQLRLVAFERCRKELLENPKPKINEKQFDEMLAALKTAADKRTKQQADLLLVANGRAKALDEAIKRFGSDDEKAELAIHLSSDRRPYENTAATCAGSCVS